MLATDKVRMLILNNPHNPTGKNFTLEEIENISKILDNYPNIIVLADEVFEFLCYD